MGMREGMCVCERQWKSALDHQNDDSMTVFLFFFSLLFFVLLNAKNLEMAELFNKTVMMHNIYLKKKILGLLGIFNLFS